MKDSKSESYKQAGVDVVAGYESIERIKPMVESTYTKGVLGSIGGFGGLFAPDFTGMERPVLISGADGVGTKLHLAFALDRHDTIGIDCVAMCVNDIICAGATPLFVLDYLAMGKNIPARTAEIVSGFAAGCRQAGAALVGGETAEMPGSYPEGEYDLAGFTVGLVDEKKIIDGSTIRPGDRLIALASSGLHSNGFSLVRKVLGDSKEALAAHVPELGCTLGEELLRPTRIYVKSILALLADLGTAVRGISNITGGGIYENVPRMLPEGLRAVIHTDKIPLPAVFKLIRERGNIPERDMYNTFNMGIGMVIALEKDKVDQAVQTLTDLGEKPYVVGCVETGEKGVTIRGRD
ncbi:MAG: phosphoribosylformylglycinamidine cyclo-ligase [Oscillospiraceae bacterium]|nr:phosphoribosylformylglycinamidine cyclo-ligase [Oscillospiraceae bacterium]